MSNKKVVLVTGGSSGIGLSICRFLNDKGYLVFGTTRSLEKAVVKENFNLIQMEVSDQKSVKNAIETIIAKQGRIDILINNAGVGITGPVEEVEDQQIRNHFEINLLGPIRVSRAVLPYMRQQNDGLIINITSIAGYMGLPFRGYYSAGKGALELLTESMRMEVKSQGISVCSIAPGDFATNISKSRFHNPVITGSAYEDVYKKSLQMMDQHVEGGSDPQIMAKKVHQIITSSNPKVHYRVGDFMQKFSIVLKKVLPDKVYEKLLMNHYKL